MTKPMIEVERCDIEPIRNERPIYGTSPSHIRAPRPVYRARLDLLLDEAGRALLESILRVGFQPSEPEPAHVALPAAPLVAEFDDEPRLG